MSGNQAEGGRQASALPSAAGSRSTRRVFIGRSAGVVLAVGGIGSFLEACGGGGGGTVNVMSWSVYVTPKVQKAFQAATGITMKALPAPDDQTMFTKVKAGGGSQYDIVFANCGWTPIYHQQGLTEVLDLDSIPAAQNLWPVFKTDTSFPYVLSPNKTLLYPNMWSSTALMWNTTAPWQPSPPPYSWNDLWKAPSGKVILHGASEDFLAMAGLALGVPPEKVYSMGGATLDRAANYLAELKPFQISQNSDAVTASALASDKAYIGFVSSLGIAYKANTQYAHKDVCRAVVPQEGALGWVDGPQLIKDAANRDNALKFIDFWGANVANQKYLWDQYYFAQASQTSTESTLNSGGKNAQIAKSVGANNPDLAKKILFLAPPKDPSAWTQAYDSVVS
jgi:spermidine/putrescine transport system substrate-binding protein